MISFNLLEFFDGRATNREVIDLLDSLPMRMKFEWADSVDSFRKWIRESHAYWGFDALNTGILGSSFTQEHLPHALDQMVLVFTRSRGPNLRRSFCPTTRLR